MLNTSTDINVLDFSLWSSLQHWKQAWPQGRTGWGRGTMRGHLSHFSPDYLSGVADYPDKAFILASIAEFCFPAVTFVPSPHPLSHSLALLPSTFFTPPMFATLPTPYHQRSLAMVEFYGFWSQVNSRKNKTKMGNIHREVVHSAKTHVAWRLLRLCCAALSPQPSPHSLLTNELPLPGIRYVDPG